MAAEGSAEQEAGRLGCDAGYKAGGQAGECDYKHGLNFCTVRRRCIAQIFNFGMFP